MLDRKASFYGTVYHVGKIVVRGATLDSLSLSCYFRTPEYRYP